MKIKTTMVSSLLLLACTAFFCFSRATAENPHAAASQVKVYKSTLTIPTYHVGRELEPPLFPDSTVTGLYPFTTYLGVSTPASPKTYPAIVIENKYLKLTYIPGFGGRFFSLYDKLRKREVFYRNDVIKPTMFNPRWSWPVFGIELTGPFDVHTLTLNGEPYWSHTVIHHNDGSVSLQLSEVDPIYHMNVHFTATLYPGIAAMKISVFCYNGTDSQKPQMFWTNADIPATKRTRFIYPMTRTVGHVSGEVSNWPLYNGVDLSWNGNNKNMLGVFGIDSYDNFAGAYQYDSNYGVFRYADRRVVQGMKLWTFGYGSSGKSMEKAYTDHAGRYIEVQSGRYIWDGHYEWVAPHETESWSEWWIPVAGIGGLTTLTRDVALNLTVHADPAGANSTVSLAVSPTRRIEKAKLVVTAKCGELLNTVVDLIPGRPVSKTIIGIKAGAGGLKKLNVRITDAAGNKILDYTRPDENPGRKQYSAFAMRLVKPQKSPSRMSVEELTRAAEFQLKEMHPGAMQELVSEALKRDPGYSRAHLLLGVYDYNSGDYEKGAEELEKATDRDPYLGKAWYYLAISQLALGQTTAAERNLYYVEPDSFYFDDSEYQLGRLAFLAGKMQKAAGHFERSIAANAYDLQARAMLALTLLSQGKKAEAAHQLDELLRLDPSNRLAYSERYFLNGDARAKDELLHLLGEQTQEALNVAIFYENVSRWREAADVLLLLDKHNLDPWGTSPIYYYTLAYDMGRLGNKAAASTYRRQARAAAAHIDRFPYRRASEAPLRAAVQADAHDALARFQLGCLLYFLHRHDEAIAQWRAAVDIKPDYFSARRELGLALSEQGDLEGAIQQLNQAVALHPDHIRTLDDLSAIYARAGQFDKQTALLERALTKSPNDDDLYMALLNSYLIQGRYQDAERIVKTHVFAPRHRSTTLRDEYRELCYGMGAAAFNKGDYARALAIFKSAVKPPQSLGVDDFQFQSNAKEYYYVGRALEALGRQQEANQAYQQAIRGIQFLSDEADSWSSNNFFLVLALERLGRTKEAKSLIPHFEGFARTVIKSENPGYRAHASYLLALIAKNAGHDAKALELVKQSLQDLPNFLDPRFELRGDVLDPIAGGFAAMTGSNSK